MAMNVFFRGVVGLASLAMAALVWAIPAQSETATPVAAQPPQELVAQTADRMIAKLKQEKDTIKKQPNRLYELVNDIVLPHFDFDLMAKRVLGKHWRSANEKQREEFVAAFRTVLVRTYANRLTEYTEYKIHYLPMRAEPEPDKATVRSEVEQPGRTPIAIDYRLALTGSAWKVYDVTIEGVSLVTNYRSNYSTEITQSGMDALIAKLNQQNEQNTAAQ